MKSEAARPFKIRLVVDHIGLVRLTIGSRNAFVPSFDVAERRLAFSVAVVLADMNLSIIINHEQRRVKSNSLRRRQSNTF